MTAEATRALIPRMTEICGPDGVLSDPVQLATYECDGLTADPVLPWPGGAADQYFQYSLSLLNLIIKGESP